MQYQSSANNFTSVEIFVVLAVSSVVTIIYLFYNFALVVII